MDYQSYVFSDYDVYFLLTRAGGWEPIELFHQNELISDVPTIERILDHKFDFVLFIGFKENKFTRQIVEHIPSFCLTDTHPKEDLPDHLFKGVMSHLSTSPHKDVLLLGACYNSEIFIKNRRAEKYVLTVGRIHPDKNQQELVCDYKERIYKKYKLPLHLVGGVNDLDYFNQVNKYVDDISVFSTTNPRKHWENTNWRTPQQIADMCNKARMFVMASPKESFCIALVEAMACGTTCVVNGNYWGFDETDIKPHVYGSTTEKRGSILDTLEEALSNDIRLDGSEWVKKFSIKETKNTLLDFVSERL